jgi:hypothetical protein
MQHLRGAIYFEDGAVDRRQLSDDGLHRTPEDGHSWHLLMRGAGGHVSSCVWYLQHDRPPTIEQLRVRRCPLRHDPSSAALFEAAVQSELDRAAKERLMYAEVGGWAVVKGSRCTAEGLVLALAAYSLGRAFGGALGLTTATMRHASATILRRIGGKHLQHDGRNIPAYYDPYYRCEMELLRFDSRAPSAKFADLIDRIQALLARVPVVAMAGADVDVADRVMTGVTRSGMTTAA